jgi:hypothetical protein
MPYLRCNSIPLRSVGRWSLVGQSVGGLVGRLVGWSVGQLVGQSVGWSTIRVPGIREVSLQKDKTPPLSVRWEFWQKGGIVEKLLEWGGCTYLLYVILLTYLLLTTTTFLGAREQV